MFIVQLVEGYRSRKPQGLYTLEHCPALGVDRSRAQFVSTWVILRLVCTPSHIRRSQTSI